ncbi:MAG TPA: aspartate/glutamate racemase family protein [Dongiaceae bacterium]|nr:aspartate/glutamate racemase family protein [Dongiaceae bacterium]
MNDAALRQAAPDQAVSLSHMPFTFDRGIAHRAAIGLIVLATDQTIEHEFRQMLAIDGVAFYETRIHNAAEINPATLTEMEKGMAGATGLILPGSTLDVVAYGCTSGTVVIGEDKVFARIREARPGIACTTPITAAIAGLKALGARRIALLTPYIESVNQMLRRFIEARGIDVPVMGSFNHENDTEVARITPDSISNAAHRLVAAAPIDAVFVSCTSLRVAAIAEALEREIGVPVTSSNHALAWHCLRLAGYREPVAGFGSLFKLPG